MRIIIISIFYFSFLSVFGQTQTEKNLKNCISSVVVNNDYKISDFYTIMKEMEFRMIKQGVLKGDKKEDYINLFKSLATKSENNIFLKFYKNNFTYLNTNFPFNVFIVNNAIFNQCPYKTSLQQNNDEEKLIYKQGEKLMEIMFSGYCDFTKIEMLIDSYKNTDFNKIINRAPIVYISLINIDNQYNPELIKYLESIKDKKSLNED